MVVGGLGNQVGIFVAGLALGIMESFASYPDRRRVQGRDRLRAADRLHPVAVAHVTGAFVGEVK